MSKVYFKPMTDKSPEAISRIAAELVAHIVKEEKVELEKHVPIKVHFGEKGNVTFVPAACYEGIIDYLKTQASEASYIETNVLYRGSRTVRGNHLEVAKNHGFTQIPIIIADGEMGEANTDVEIDQTYFKTCKIGEAFSHYEQFIVCSHFKGHGSAGFGGAVKQLAMGFASRGGKMAQHASMVPTVYEDKCTACGLCVKKCDVEAITLPNKAAIDASKCIGCAGCIAVCPVGAVRNDWSGQNFKEKLAEYAYAAQLGKRNVYVTFLMNVTAECDCMGQKMEAIAEDVGIFVGLDPIAIDKACYDMLAKSHGHPLFTAGLPQLEHGQVIGLGTMNYELIEVL